MTPIEKYLHHLDLIFQQEPLFYKNESNINGLPGVTSIVYKDVPEKGFVTGLTYGLSLVNHSEWTYSRPELCISVESSNIDWGQVVGYVANQLRGESAFCYGDTINFREKIHEESEMDAFLIFAPSILEKKDFLDIDIGTEYKISISGLFPIYSDEIEVYHRIGLEKFWHHPNFDLYSIKRKHIT